MVLPTVLYCVSDSLFPPMMEGFQEVCRQENAYLRITMRTDRYEEAEKAIAAAGGVTLLITCVSDVQSSAGHQALRLGRQAMACNRDNYVIYSARDNKTMVQMAPYCTRPAGIVTDGILSARGQRLLRDIIRDYQSVYEEPAPGPFISFKTKSAVHRVNVRDICAVMSVNKANQVCMLKDSMIVYDSLESIGKKLGEGFCRCHRSCLINVERIERVDFRNMTIVMMNGMEVPLARSFRQAFHAIADQKPHTEKEGEGLWSQ